MLMFGGYDKRHQTKTRIIPDANQLLLLIKIQEAMDKQEISIVLPDIPSTKYQTYITQIQNLVKSLNQFTNNLDQKVSNMLKGQETQFVNSYKNHMNKVENAMKQFQHRIEEYQKKIEYYQNEGIIATYLKKIAFYEVHEKKLMAHIDIKDNTIKMLKEQLSIQSNEIKNLQQKIKQLMRHATKLENSKKLLVSDNVESQPTFTTQLSPQISKYNIKTTTENRSIEKSIEIKNQYQTINEYQTLQNPESISKRKELQLIKALRMEKQINQLKRKNRELSSFNSKIIEKSSSLEDFFLKIVNQLKRKIAARKKIQDCSFENFQQEDKLELLIKILSNDQILKHLYEKIFNKKALISNPNDEQRIQKDQQRDIELLKMSQRLKESTGTRLFINPRFPSIQSQRR